MAESKSATIHPELMVSSVLHLMSNYVVRSQESGSCLKLACIIERHLTALAELPNLAPVIRATCEQLSDQWLIIVEQAQKSRDKPGLLKRLTSRRED
jgi:hypothetical protein